MTRSLKRIVAPLPWCSSVCLSGTGVHCDQTVHFSTDLSLRLDSPMFWAYWHQSTPTYSQPSLSSITWKRGGVWMCKLGMISQQLKIDVKLLLSANRKSYMPRWLAQQWMTLSDLEWPFHRSYAISAVAELLVMSGTLTSCDTYSILHNFKRTEILLILMTNASNL